jgi:esterase/lipase
MIEGDRISSELELSPERIASLHRSVEKIVQDNKKILQSNKKYLQDTNKILQSNKNWKSEMDRQKAQHKKEETERKTKTAQHQKDTAQLKEVYAELKKETAKLKQDIIALQKKKDDEEKRERIIYTRILVTDYCEKNEFASFMQSVVTGLDERHKNDGAVSFVFQQKNLTVHY